MLRINSLPKRVPLPRRPHQSFREALRFLQRHRRRQVLELGVEPRLGHVLHCAARRAARREPAARPPAALRGQGVHRPHAPMDESAPRACSRPRRRRAPACFAPSVAARAARPRTSRRRQHARAGFDARARARRPARADGGGTRPRTGWRWARSSQRRFTARTASKQCLARARGASSCAERGAQVRAVVGDGARETPASATRAGQSAPRRLTTSGATARSVCGERRARRRRRISERRDGRRARAARRTLSGARR